MMAVVTLLATPMLNIAAEDGSGAMRAVTVLIGYVFLVPLAGEIARNNFDTGGSRVIMSCASASALPYGHPNGDNL